MSPSGAASSSFPSRRQRSSTRRRSVNEGRAFLQPLPSGPVTDGLRTSRTSWPSVSSMANGTTRADQPNELSWRRLGWADHDLPATPMMPNALLHQLDDERIGEEIFAVAAELYPICRSITGDGVRATLNHVRKHVP